MTRPQTFSCFLIGEGSLLTQCGVILARRGHEICGVLSSDDGVKAWAQKEHIDVCSDKISFTGFLSKRPFDYLFSIVNEHVLTQDVLQLPRKLAVNYHDALLPRYAGNYATSWAILNREVTHGVTWHVMTSKVDAGDILRQRRVEIASNETAFTLNAKCYEAAILSFEELVEDLSRGTVKAVPQGLEDRTFFAKDKRPEAGCLISWNRAAADIAALIRALDFGTYSNPIGLPKVAIAKDFVVPKELTVLDSGATEAPGTITKILDNSITVSTADYQIALSRFATLDGELIPIPFLVSEYQLVPGYRFRDLDDSVRDKLTSLYRSSSENERFWTKTLSQLQPLEFSGHLIRRSAAKTAEASIRLPDEFMSCLHSLEGQGDSSDTLIAAFAVYLARIAESSCFDIGFSDEKTEFTGIFAASVPLRIQVDMSKTFVETLGSITQQLRSVKKHGTYPRDIVSRVPELRGRLKERAAFDLPFSVRLTATEIDGEVDSRHALTLIIPESGKRCYWRYSSDVFDDNLVRGMARQFGMLVETVVRDPGLVIGQIPLLTTRERHQQLVEWNSTACEYPYDKCINNLFEAQVHRSPHQPAVEFESESISYYELNRRANQLAHHLRELGVGPEVLVGVCLQRSMNLAVALLAILKAGGAYLPLDPTFPEERLLFIINDSRTRILVTDRHLSPKFPDDGQRTICLDEEWSQIQSKSDEQLDCLSTPDNLAYVVYTSGSTGSPKGVAVSHRAVVNHSVAIAKSYNLSARDRTLQFASISFDVAAEELFPSWFSGATVVLLPERARASFPAFLEFLNAKRLTLVNLPTSFWQEFLVDLSVNDLPSSLRLVVIGNEKASLDGLATWQRVVGKQIRLINAYGPTETTITASTYEWNSGNENQSNSVPIGRPIANVQMYLLDTLLQPVPIGIPGELHIGGAGLARGYLNHPDLTAEKFIPNPFSESDGARLYKTGDIVRYLPNGEIEFLSRKDQQVKIRGFRIEPGEIESVLRRSNLLRDAAVVARKDESGDNQLVAYVVLLNRTSGELEMQLAEDKSTVEKKASSEASLSAIKSYLREQLPDYMVPSAFVVMDRLPLTASGKIDYRALPSPNEESFESTGDIVGPRNVTEELLIEIWKQLLKIERVSVTDNFFDLGGHSLMAVRMFSKIEKQFGKTLSIATLFKAPTIQKLAECFTEAETSNDWSCLVPIQTTGDKPPLFCVHAAGGNILFYRDLVHCLEPDQPVYGFQARGLDGKHSPHTSVEEMAASYVYEMRRIQPEGPYYVAGGSFGGLVAFEIAKQLEAMGAELGVVALFDTYAPGYPKNLPSLTKLQKAVYRVTLRIENHLGNLAASDWKGRLAYIKNKTVKGRVMGIRACRRSFEQLKRKMRLTPENVLPTRLQQTEDAVRRCSDHYNPQPYAGRVILFRAQKQPRGIYPEPELGWGRFVTGHIEIYEVPGIHGSILSEPRVRVLAQKLNDCLRSARGQHSNFVISQRLMEETLTKAAAVA